MGLLDGEGTGYCLNVESDGADVVHKNLTLHNTGCRAAFVKLLITYGESCFKFKSRLCIL